MIARSIVTFTAALMIVTPAMAQRGAPGMGPVAEKCVEESARFCAGKEHGNRALRTCLEQNRAKLGAACKSALDQTGPGRGQGRGRGGNWQ